MRGVPGVQLRGKHTYPYGDTFDENAFKHGQGESKNETMLPLSMHSPPRASRRE